MTHKPIVLTVGALAILVGAFFALNAYIYEEKQGTDTPVLPYKATLSGEVVCLPHKDTTGPQTMECAFGLKTDVGEYYVLDFGGEVPNIPMNEKLTFSGTITPIEMLSTDMWQKYPIEGIFSVADKDTLIREYVKENISALSPEKEVLGGTFYVTEVRLDNGEGMVFYEDGHNAFVADFTYSFSEDTPEIKNFAVRKGELEEGGEADPDRMTLSMKTWEWTGALYNDGTRVRPNKPGVFTLTFFPDENRFGLSTDCNSMGGNYSVTGNKIAFSEMISTKMYCEGSQENLVAQLLSDTTSYHFTARGELILDLKFDSGTVTFK